MTYGLDNVVVLFLHAELDLAARVGMALNKVLECASPVDVSYLPRPRIDRSMSPAFSCLINLLPHWRRPRSRSATTSEVSLLSNVSTMLQAPSAITLRFARYIGK